MEMMLNAEGLAAPSDVREAASENIASGAVVGLSVSGKMASGKDTVAPLVLAEVEIVNPVQMSFAQSLKAEFSAAMEAVAAASDEHAGGVSAAEALGVDLHHGLKLASLVFADIAANPNLTAKDRTPGIRSALQYLGTDIRRSTDELYWVRRTLDAALPVIAEGTSVFFTDARFPNEIDAARSVGMFCVMLEVSEETQKHRLFERDGIALDPVAAAHPSETALDSYRDFDLILDNNGSVASAVDHVVSALTAERTPTG